MDGVDLKKSVLSKGKQVTNVIPPPTNNNASNNSSMKRRKGPDLKPIVTNESTTIDSPITDSEGYVYSLLLLLLLLFVYLFYFILFFFFFF